VHKDRADGCTEFEEWLHDAFTAQGSFTTLVVLVWIGETQVAPLASTYCNIIGDETNWAEIVALFDGAGQDWNGAAFFPVFDAEGLLEARWPAFACARSRSVCTQTGWYSRRASSSINGAAA
jgi:hypothetical protein